MAVRPQGWLYPGVYVRAALDLTWGVVNFVDPSDEVAWFYGQEDAGADVAPDSPYRSIFVTLCGSVSNYGRQHRRLLADIGQHLLAHVPRTVPRHTPDESIDSGGCPVDRQRSEITERWPHAAQFADDDVRCRHQRPYGEPEVTRAVGNGPVRRVRPPGRRMVNPGSMGRVAGRDRYVPA